MEVTIMDPENSKIPFTAEHAEDTKRSLSFWIPLCILCVLCGETFAEASLYCVFFMGQLTHKKMLPKDRLHSF
jgi:hypothetical protein